MRVARRPATHQAEYPDVRTKAYGGVRICLLLGATLANLSEESALANRVSLITSRLRRLSKLRRYALLSILVGTYSPALWAETAQSLTGDPTEPLRAINSAYLPSCRPLPPKDSNLPPDDFNKVFKALKRYRLVIGVGNYQDNPHDNDLPFAEPTAAAVDARLGQVGYDPLPSRVKAGLPAYITGSSATLATINAALQEMAEETQENGFGVIYWVGHGDMVPGNVDLLLPVYDKPLGNGEGVRVAEMVNTLALGPWQPKDGILEIPHFLIVLDTCYSGTFLKKLTVVSTVNGRQRLLQTPTRVLPDQIAMISSTGAGSTNQGFPLNGTKLSAFGAYFARALDEDWTCADQNFDGMLTVQELAQHLQRVLHNAPKIGATPKEMVPDYSGTLAFAAYSSDRYRQYPGERENLQVLIIEPSSLITAAMSPIPSEVQLPERNISIPCPRSCRLVLSKALKVITIQTVPDTSFGFVESVPPPQPPVVVKIDDLKTGDHRVQGGVKVSLQ